MSKSFGIAALVLALGGSTFAQNVPPSADWQKVRAQQPAALHLKMTLAKDHFYQGEKIDATVDFINDDPKTTYSLAIGAGAPGAIFHAQDAQGHDLIDPLQWVTDWMGFSGTGPVQFYPIGRYTMTRPVNENVRFDQPGVYSIYAQTSVMQGSDPFKNPNQPRIDLVSDPVTVTITPLSPEQEEQAIAAAHQKIGTQDENYYFGQDAGVEELNFLQTPAARAELISVLGMKNLGEEAATGLVSSPDPLVEADHILAAVQGDKLALDENGVDLYAELRLFGLFGGHQPKDYTKKQMNDIFTQRIPLMNKARQEITAALVKASGDRGPAHIEALWTAYKEQAIYRNPGDPDPDGGAARRALAEHQLELPPNHVTELLRTWPYWGNVDFLPLIRREVKAGTNDPAALVILAGLSPDEARPLIIAELSQPDSKLLKTYYPSSQLFPDIAPMPLPQFDTLFRTKLVESGGNPTPIIAVIGCFGSDKLLPDVVEAFHKNGARWDDAIKQNFYFYWMRCDPKEGCVAFEQEITSRGKEGWGFFIDALRTSRRDEARPAIRWALANSDPSLAGEAIYLLVRHGDDSDLDSLIATLERLRTQKDYGPSTAIHARTILADTRWHLTDEQKKRLETVAASSPSQ